MEEKKAVEMSNGKSISMETLLKLDESFNIAHLLGKAIQALAYEVQPTNEENEPQDAHANNGIVFGEGGKPSFPSDKYEANIVNQMNQLKALFSPDVFDLIRPSALYGMLLSGADQLGVDEKTLVKEWHSVPIAPRAAIAWAIAKRVFSIRHPEDSIRIISLADIPAANRKPILYTPLDDTDRLFIAEVCSSVDLDELGSEAPLEATLEKISQIPPQDVRYIPLLSKPFREQRAIAARRDFTRVSVGGGATIRARIGREGEGPVELSEFEMLIQQVIGEMIQYYVRFHGDNSLPIRITPEQIFRWMYYDQTNMAKPSPEVRKQIVTAVDKLIQTPAELHILEQLEKHTQLKSKPGFKKLLKNEGKMIGTLITGKHYSASYNGKALEDTFVIYDMPMFFYYSSFTGHLLKIDSKLITGETVKTTQTRKTYNDVILREHIVYRVNLIKKEKNDKNKEIYKKAKRNGEKAKPINNYTKTILLSSLAEESDITLDTPKKLEVFRNKVLDYLKELAAQGEIKKSEPKYESRKITGVSVTV